MLESKFVETLSGEEMKRRSNKRAEQILSTHRGLLKKAKELGVDVMEREKKYSSRIKV